MHFGLHGSYSSGLLGFNRMLVFRKVEYVTLRETKHVAPNNFCYKVRLPNVWSN